MTRIINSILLTFFVFFACFCWVYYLTKLGDTSLWAASIMAFATLCLSLTKRTGKAAANKKIAKQLALQFALYGDNGVVEQLYQFAGYTTQKISNGIVATKGDENTFVAVEFTTKNCSVDRVIALSKTARNSGCNNLDLFCKNVDGELAKYVDLFPVAVTVYDAKSTTLLLTKYNKIPQLNITK